MKRFYDFVCEQDGMPAAAPQQMNPSANQMPPTGPTPAGQNPGQEQDKPAPPEAARELEGLSNEIQKAMDRMFKIISHHKMSRDKYKQILTTMIHSIADQGDLSNANLKQVTNNAVRTNSEPVNPPMQPQNAG